MKWWRKLREAWLREPPADWFLSAYFKYEPPDEAMRRKDGSYSSNARWSKALENTMKMAFALGIKDESKPQRPVL